MTDTRLEQATGGRWQPFSGQPVRIRWELPKYEESFKRGLALAQAMVPSGTQTLQARQLAEQIRQFDEEMKYRREALAQERQLALAQLAAARAGGAQPYEPKTAGERAAQATAEFVRVGQELYRKYREAGYSHPLYETLAVVLRDPEMTRTMQKWGVSPTDVANALIVSLGRVTPTEYFARGRGQELRTLYEHYLDPGVRGTFRLEVEGLQKQSSPSIWNRLFG